MGGRDGERERRREGETERGRRRGRAHGREGGRGREGVSSSSPVEAAYENHDMSCTQLSLPHKPKAHLISLPQTAFRDLRLEPIPMVVVVTMGNADYMYFHCYPQRACAARVL